MSKKLSRLPTPKKRRVRKISNPRLIKRLLLLSIKIIEKVKKRLKKAKKKKAGNAKKTSGSTKTTKKERAVQAKRVAAKRGRAFCLFLRFSFRRLMLELRAMEFFLLLLIMLAGFGLLAFAINKKLAEIAGKEKPVDELLEVIKLLQEGSKEDRKVLLQSLQANTQSLNERLDNAAQVIGKVQKNIGEMSEIGRSMRDLQEFLQSPKLRGNIGEQVLKELLSQMLPKQSFHLQYAFKSGEKVDAAIKTAAGMVPIDSKFPMENFRKMTKVEADSERKGFKRQFEKDVKKHIKTISQKYILTEEGTIDYALMYVPSEAVYYEIVNNASLFEYAADQRVLPVSPTTFYAYLRAILMSFEGQKIEARAREILVAIRAVQKNYGKVEEDLGVLQSHFTRAYNKMGEVTNSFARLGQKIDRTQALGREETKKLDS